MTDTPDRARKKVGTDPYKGVRDFYPEDMFFEQYLFETIRDVVEHFGYEEYTCSPLESAELYAAKSSEEIVSEQTYTFTDRGGRQVTLRPEMTPSVARMIAARRRELPFPLRWYSIPNVFRYERPQRGRLREHMQLNCDLFGVASTEGDVEVILLAYEIMRAFGASEREFEIHINHRVVIPEILTFLAEQHRLTFPEDKRRTFMQLMDRKDKLTETEYADALHDLIGDGLAQVILDEYRPEKVRAIIENTEAGKTLLELLAILERRGIANVSYDPYLVRGFDYYSGTIFEVFDTSEANKRSLFGGGRYDNLLDIFGVTPVPAVGFGMGDVTLRDFLETHHLLPAYESPTDLYITVTAPSSFAFAAQLAQRLRRRDLTVAVDLSGRKLGDQVKTAIKKHIPFCLAAGEDEEKSGMYKLKHLDTSREIVVGEQEIADAIFQILT